MKTWIEARTSSVPVGKDGKPRIGKGMFAEVIDALPRTGCWDLAEDARYCHKYVERYHADVAVGITEEDYL